jgi:hypothetical protein
MPTLLLAAGRVYFHPIINSKLHIKYNDFTPSFCVSYSKAKVHI